MGVMDILPFPQTNKNTVVRAIRDVASRSEDVIISTHAKERMGERGILRIEIDKCLREGQQQGECCLTKHGDWQAEIVHNVAGKRLVVQAVLAENGRRKVVVVTAWRLI